ncbi:hypothetical protein NDU88_002462 [Pleurodeles waltl]|uniref:Uncharacterized protein n=1 Tax=Pleurodeles waltl TaxID=8319 RepID=A0AAV7MPQ4_PLEWA|nr:hypothetical protein NDU88_002462 [Pleurodeles waltl]
MQNGGFRVGGSACENQAPRRQCYDPEADFSNLKRKRLLALMPHLQKRGVKYDLLELGRMLIMVDGWMRKYGKPKRLELLLGGWIGWMTP